MTTSSIIKRSINDQLAIRYVTLPDVLSFYRILKNPRVYKRIDLSNSPSLLSEVKWYKSYRSGAEGIVWSILYTGKVVGNCRLSNFSDNPNKAEFGIIIDEKYWGRGIGTAICLELIKISKHDLNLNYLYLEVQKTNERAKSLYSVIGFQPHKETASHLTMLMELV